MIVNVITHGRSLPSQRCKKTEWEFCTKKKNLISEKRQLVQNLNVTVLCRLAEERVEPWRQRRMYDDFRTCFRVDELGAE